MVESITPKNKDPRWGRLLLRTGSWLTILVLLTDSLTSLYFVTTAHPRQHQYGIKPGDMVLLILLSIPVLIFTGSMIIRGYQIEVQAYRDELKKLDQRATELLKHETY